MIPRNDMLDPRPCAKVGYEGGDNETLRIHDALAGKAEPSANKERHESASYQKLKSQQRKGKKRRYSTGQIQGRESVPTETTDQGEEGHRRKERDSRPGPAVYDGQVQRESANRRRNYNGTSQRDREAITVARG